MNLFKGYANAADEDFTRYIQNKRDDYEDGSTLTVENLMMLAINKYELKVENNTWSVADKKDNRIIALEAEVEKLKSSKGTRKGNGGNINSGNDDNNKYAWKTIPPAPGAPRFRLWNKKQYHWCPTHEAWTIHTPESCNGKKGDTGNKTKTEPTPPAPSASTSEKQSLYLNQALQAIQEDQEDDSDV